MFFSHKHQQQDSTVQSALGCMFSGWIWPVPRAEGFSVAGIGENLEAAVATVGISWMQQRESGMRNIPVPDTVYKTAGCDISSRRL